MKTIDIFDAKLQKVVPHNGYVDGNGEFVFTSTESDSFVKFPADTTTEQFKELLVKHEVSNVGQVSVEAQEKKLNILLGEEDTPVEPTEPTA